ncbi:unnamed protein product [Moneuplotes crassus]|uniref:Uncharacterized protein n=1 Tax=Euplotes crassus TaxID=5936 RepID=A0AAD1YDF7_EUPCR|nr:unnamed protein product [Moneuplotes crassus]
MNPSKKLLDQIFNPKNVVYEGGRRNEQGGEKHGRSKSKPITNLMNDLKKKKDKKLNFVRRREQEQEKKNQKSSKSVEAQGRRMVLHRLSNGNIPAYTAGPLQRERYINPKMEAELVTFKKEVDKRFKKSLLKDYKFPLKDRETQRLHEHRGGYVLPLIHQDLSKNSDTKDNKIVKNILSNLTSSCQKFDENVISKEGIKTSRETVNYDRSQKPMIGSVTVREHTHEMKPRYTDSQAGSISLKNKKRLFAKIQQLYQKPGNISENTSKESMSGNNKLYITYKNKVQKPKKKRTIIKDQSDIEVQISRKLERANSSKEFVSRNNDGSRISKKSQTGSELHNESSTNFGFYKTYKNPSAEFNSSQSQLGKYKRRVNKATVNCQNPNLTSVFKSKAHLTAEEFKKLTQETRMLRKKSNSSLKYKLTKSSDTTKKLLKKKSLKLLKNYEPRNYPQIVDFNHSEEGSAVRKPSQPPKSRNTKNFQTERKESRERKSNFRNLPRNNYQLTRIKSVKRSNSRNLSSNRN